MTKPQGGLTFVDSHAHLDEAQFSDDLDDVLQRAAGAGIKRIVNIGYEPARWTTSITLANQHPQIAFTLGLHPNSSDQYRPELIDELGDLAASTAAVAIGEIGLDFFRDGASPDLQLKSFEAQLALAATLRLPVVIHQRNASAEVRRVLRAASPDTRCVLHSFDGEEDLVELGLERGYLFGIGGLMTRSSSERLRQLIRRMPLDQMLLETDSPYLVPASLKSRRNEPANIPLIAEALAGLLEVSTSAVADTTSRNAIDIFRLDAKVTFADTIR